jgi:hypothetical protein
MQPTKKGAHGRVVPRAVGWLPQSAVTLPRRPHSRFTVGCVIDIPGVGPRRTATPALDYGRWDPLLGWVVAPTVAPPYARCNRYRTGRRGLRAGLVDVPQTQRCSGL